MSRIISRPKRLQGASERRGFRLQGLLLFSKK